MDYRLVLSNLKFADLQFLVKISKKLVIVDMYTKIKNQSISQPVSK